MKKNFITLLFGLIFLESVIIIILPNTPVKPTPLTTWQSYRNEKYGFEFQYPNNYKIDGDDIISVSNPDEKYSRILIDFKQFKDLPYPLGQYFKNKTASQVCIYNSCPVEYKVSHLPNFTLISYDFGFSSTYNYLIHKPEYGYISLSYEINGDVDDPSRNTIDSYQQILSTFKFTQ